MDTDKQTVTGEGNAPRVLEVGSYSSDTMRSRDLIPAFIDALRSVDEKRADEIENAEENKGVFEWLETAGIGDETDEASDLVNELFDVLNEYCPPYCSFGSTEGDGACYGCWPCVESAKENVDFVSSRENEYPPDDFEGEWLHVSDHGNATLYVREKGEDKEIWAIV
jgi:hypothetical protein